MRVCAVAYTFYETDNRVMRYAQALAERGDHVDVIAVAKCKESKRFEIINGVHVYRLQLRELNENTKFDYLGRILLFLINSLIFLSARLFKRRYDVIHIHSVPDFLVFSAITQKIMGAKLILDIHDLVPELFVSKFNSTKSGFFYKSLLFVEKLSTWFVDHVIIANHIWHKKLTGRSVPEEKCSAYLNYPDQSIFYPRKVKEPNEEFTLAYPGTLSYHQGVDVLVKAVGIVKDDIPNIKLNIYGGGVEEDNLKQMAKELDVEKQVELHGLISLPEVAERMSECDLAVEPKRSESFSDEAFSTKIFEFMSVGVPVLCSRTSVHEYYLDETCVKFYEAGNEKELAEKLLMLVKDPEERKRMRENSSQFIRQHNWDTHRERYFELVDTLSINGKVKVVNEAA